MGAIVLKKIFALSVFSLLLLVGCSQIDSKTESFIKEYLTLRYETVNMINQEDSDVYSSIEHTELVKPYLSKERYEEYASKRESQQALQTDDYVVEKGGTMKIDSIDIEEVNKNEYNYKSIITINNPTENLRTTVTGLLKIDEDGLIYYDWRNRELGVTKVID